MRPTVQRSATGPTAPATASRPVAAGSRPRRQVRALPPLAALALLAALAVLAGLAEPATGEPANGRPPVPVAYEERAPTTGYDWPVAGDPPEVLLNFDPPPKPWLPGHRGVDLAASAGAPVRAAGPGTVAFAGLVAGRPVVSIQHPGGLRTTYEPVNPQVRAGDAVETGTVLGQLADAGSHCARACLHWGLRTGADDYLDPLLLVGADGVIRLYPTAQGPAAEDTSG